MSAVPWQFYVPLEHELGPHIYYPLTALMFASPDAGIIQIGYLPRSHDRPATRVALVAGSASHPLAFLAVAWLHFATFEDAKDARR